MRRRACGDNSAYDSRRGFERANRPAIRAQPAARRGRRGLGGFLPGLRGLPRGFLVPHVVATHNSVDGLLDSFVQIRSLAVQAKADRRLRLRSDELNLLRAALVFTSSGLDSRTGRGRRWA